MQVEPDRIVFFLPPPPLSFRSKASSPKSLFLSASFNCSSSRHYITSNSPHKCHFLRWVAMRRKKNKTPHPRNKKTPHECLMSSYTSSKRRESSTCSSPQTTLTPVIPPYFYSPCLDEPPARSYLFIELHTQFILHSTASKQIISSYFQDNPETIQMFYNWYTR